MFLIHICLNNVNQPNNHFCDRLAGCARRLCNPSGVFRVAFFENPHINRRVSVGFVQGQSGGVKSKRPITARVPFMFWLTPAWKTPSYNIPR